MHASLPLPPRPRARVNAAGCPITPFLLCLAIHALVEGQQSATGEKFMQRPRPSAIARSCLLLVNMAPSEARCRSLHPVAIARHCICASLVKQLPCMEPVPTQAEVPVWTVLSCITVYLLCSGICQACSIPPQSRHIVEAAAVSVGLVLCWQNWNSTDNACSSGSI